MRQYILLIFLIVFQLFNSLAQENSSTWIWQISGGELQKKSYIVGTFPIQDSLAFQFPDKVWKYLEKTDVLAFIQEENPALSQQVRNQSFSTFRKNFGTDPIGYFKSVAETQLKPQIGLNKEFSLSHFYTNSTKVENPMMANKALEDYMSALIDQLAEDRQQLDVPSDVLQQITSRTNYELLNELIRYMSLQPVFFAVDATYLSGDNGLIQLFRARGFQVKALEDKYYAQQAETIQYKNAMQAQWQNEQNLGYGNAANQEVTNTPSTNVIVAPTQPTEYVKLDLPTGILNLDQWSQYEINDSLITYLAPVRLKLDEDRPNTYSASYGGLNYSIEIVPKWKNLKQGIEQVVIRNGGQLVSDNKYTNGLVSGEKVELMYAENQVSKHLLIEGSGEENYVVSVKGSTPEIFTVVANNFLESFYLSNPIAQVDDYSATEIAPAPVIVTWMALSDHRLGFNFPSVYDKSTSKLDNGKSVTTYSSSKKLDENTYVLVVSQRDAFDNFKLFNDAINTATQELRGVVKERNVMPDGNSNKAEYLVEDAVGNSYRIQYLYDGTNFYQFYIKGDKKSVANANANFIFQTALIN